jgi:hypothetical protein
MFAEMPLDNRTVNISAALAATSGFPRPFKPGPFEPRPFEPRPPLETSPPAKRSNISSWLIVL